MSPSFLQITLAGEELVLLPSGAAYVPRHRTLLAADVHFGKAWSFRRLGIPVPEATTAHTLASLSQAITHTGAQQLIFLGDFLHSARGRSQRLLAELAQWRAGHAGLAMTLVRGNHDVRAGDPPASLGMELVDEPLRLGPFALCHHPRPVADAYVLAGHWHPCVQVGRGFDRLRLPCFWFGQPRADCAGIGILPAFGSFTGMHPIEAVDNDRVFAIAGQTVRLVGGPPASASLARVNT